MWAACEKTYLLTPTSNKDSTQPAHLRCPYEETVSLAVQIALSEDFDQTEIAVRSES